MVINPSKREINGYQRIIRIIKKTTSLNNIRIAKAQLLHGQDNIVQKQIIINKK